MNYSYVMGVTNVDKLKDEGFIIKKYDEDFGVTFSDDKIDFFENFICESLENGFWNEHLGKEMVFIFKFMDGKIKKYVINDDNKNEVLKLCSEFANCEFESFEKLLRDNGFYTETYFKNC